MYKKQLWPLPRFAGGGAGAVCFHLSAEKIKFYTTHSNNIDSLYLSTHRNVFYLKEYQVPFLSLKLQMQLHHKVLTLLLAS